MPVIQIPSVSQEPHPLARTWCEVDLHALRRNYRRVGGRLPEGGRLILSAKKEAYGHGLPAITAALQNEQSFGAIGLATIEEALELRGHFAELPIILFTILSGEALDEAIGAGLIVTVTNLNEAVYASQAAVRLGIEAKAHLKVDTGMGRLGRLAGEVAGEIPAIRALPGLRIEAVYSHFADAWAQPKSAVEQIRRFEEFRQAGCLTDLPIHWGGSDVLSIADQLAPRTWLRAGIAVYGDHPALSELEPVMTFKTRVVYRRAVPPGTTISYGMTLTTKRASELAVVGAGYGNGYPRILGNRASVLIGGIRRPILGRVCMDQFVVDVTDAPNVAVGDEVVLFGKQGEAVLPAAEVAAAAETISYELFCLAGGMNPRVYLPSPAAAEGS